MAVIWAEQALTAAGWQSAVRIEVAGGRVVAVRAGAVAEGTRVGALLPAPVNLHSHAFQRAMAGMTERRGADLADSFWTWRALMYRFLDHLTPEDVAAIAAFAQVEMLEAGYGAVAEFHYLHHRPGGAAYDDLAEMSRQIIAAADLTGIGLTLLPVLYRQGGVDGRALGAGQARFGCTRDQFAALHAACRTLMAADGVVGVAPHSLRAVSAGDLTFVAGVAPGAPVHVHVAEQVAEVVEISAAYGARPVEWLLGNADAGPRWCLIHATQMEAAETEALAASGAVAGLCPITEASLGDGIFDGVRYLGAGGRFGVGTDSNISVSLAGELRLLEYAQRLRDRGRAMLATAETSTGRVLFEGAARGGAQAAGRGAGVIAVGEWADLLALDTSAVDLEGRRGDDLLDAWIFASGGVADVWAAGRHVVTGGRHVRRAAVVADYRRVMARLRGVL